MPIHGKSRWSLSRKRKQQRLERLETVREKPDSIGRQRTLMLWHNEKIRRTNNLIFVFRTWPVSLKTSSKPARAQLSKKRRLTAARAGPSALLFKVGFVQLFFLSVIFNPLITVKLIADPARNSNSVRINRLIPCTSQSAILISMMQRMVAVRLTIASAFLNHPMMLNMTHQHFP
jgi:hypothetical protein